VRIREGLYAVLAASLLAAGCGQRGSLYLPGKPGDPYYDRQNRAPTPGQTNSPNNTKPAAPPKRDEDPAS
jgi:predicted small lipoprotein YifL